MGPPNSAASGSAAAMVVGASPGARVRRSRVATVRTDILALGVRWSVRSRLREAEVSHWLAERGVLVDQSPIDRWVQRCLPVFGEGARKHRDPVGPDGRVDQTYARIRSRWHSISRASDGCGQSVDAYLSPTRDAVAARRFFERAIASGGTPPRRVITDTAASYPPALTGAMPGVLHRTGRHRTHGIERDHGVLKDRLRPMRGLESVASAAISLPAVTPCCGPSAAVSLGSSKQFRRGWCSPGPGVDSPQLCDWSADPTLTYQYPIRGSLSLFQPTQMQENRRGCLNSLRLVGLRDHAAAWSS
jgi:transposase, IS6 family